LASDLLKPGLELVFCGYNPSLASGRSGHHYAHPGNRFWRVLFAAGITGRLYMPEEDARLLEENRYGFGQGVYGSRRGHRGHAQGRPGGRPGPRSAPPLTPPRLWWRLCLILLSGQPDSQAYI